MRCSFWLSTSTPCIGSARSFRPSVKSSRTSPVVLPRRQDRRARPERRGQVHPAADHGRRRHRDRRRGPADAGDQRRLPAAGAQAGPAGHRARHRRRGRRPDQAGPGAAGRGLCRLCRAGCRLRRPGRRAGQAGGDPAGIRRTQPGTPAGSRRRRPAPAAVGCQGRAPVRRRKAPRSAVPSAAVGSRHAAAGRTDQPPGRRLGGLAGAFPARLPRHRGGDHPRPLLPRQRRRLDPRTRPWPWHPVRRQLLRLAGIQGRPPGPGSQAGSLPRQGHEGRAGVGTPGRQGPPGQVQGACSASRNCSRRNSRSAARPTRSTSRPVRAWATRSSNCTM